MVPAFNAKSAGASTKLPSCPRVVIFEYEPSSKAQKSNEHLEARAKSLLASLPNNGAAGETERPLIYIVQAGTTVLRELGAGPTGNTSRIPDQTPDDRQWQSSPLITAVEKSLTDDVARLLSANATVMQSREGALALMKAVDMDAVDLVAMMLKKSICSDGFDKLVPTPLSVAVKKGNSRIVRLLVRKRAKFSTADSDGKTPLIIAATQGHEEIVRSLLVFGADIEAGDFLGRNALHSASLRGRSSMVKILAEERADLTARDIDRYSPLHLAVAGKNSDVVNILIDLHADVATTNRDGDTPLETAIRKGYTSIMKRLVLAGASVEPLARRPSPLHLAAKCKQSEALDLLLVLGAPPGETNTELDNALHIAVKAGHNAAIDILVKAGCAIDSLNATGYSPLRLAIEGGFVSTVRAILGHQTFHTVTEDTKAALLYAMNLKDPEIMAMFLNHGTIVDLKVEYNKTLLHIAVNSLRPGSVAVLLVHDAQINVEDDHNNTPLTLAMKTPSTLLLSLILAHRPHCITKQCCHQNTPLVYAAKNNYTHVIELLLTTERELDTSFGGNETAALLAATGLGLSKMVKCQVGNGVELDRMDSEGVVAIDRAASDGNINMINTLLGLGAKLDNTHSATDPRTTLQRAVGERHKEAANLLLDKGANIEAALHYACYGKVEDTDMVELLLKRNAKVDGRRVQRNVNNTALHLAVKRGFRETAKILLDHGADPLARNFYGDTPVMLAEFW